jgi:hypothetical protein
MEKQSKPEYWFKRKRYGYGWTPVTWQGGATVVAFVVVVLAASIMMERVPEDDLARGLGVYVAVVVMALVMLLLVTVRKAPKGKWRWGAKDGDNPEEDL